MTEASAHRTRDRRLFLAVAATVLACDQVTKELVRQALAVGERFPGPGEAISRYFTVTHVANTGVSFGMLPGQSDLLSLLALTIIAILLYYRRRAPAGATWLNLALGLQVGGALGNLVDRLRIGHVTDFLDFQFWPVFNVADASIFVGVLLLTWHLWQDERSQRAAAASVVARPSADSAEGGATDRGDGGTAPDAARG